MWENRALTFYRSGRMILYGIFRSSEKSIDRCKVGRVRRREIGAC